MVSVVFALLHHDPALVVLPVLVHRFPAGVDSPLWGQGCDGVDPLGDLHVVPGGGEVRRGVGPILAPCGDGAGGGGGAGRDAREAGGLGGHRRWCCLSVFTVNTTIRLT